jgi:hypothetical protein
MTTRTLTVIAGMMLAGALLSVPSGAADGDASLTARVRVHTPPSPLAIELSLARAEIMAGQQAVIRAVVHNPGTEAVHDVEISLHASEANIHIQDPTVMLGTIGPGRRANTTWRACSSAPGTYLLAARTRASIHGETAESFSPAYQLAITPPPGRSGPNCTDR